jgi:hypothetical protein
VETGRDVILDSETNEANIEITVEDTDIDDNSESSDDDVAETLDQALFGSLEFIFYTLDYVLEQRKVTKEDFQDLKDAWESVLFMNTSIREEHELLLGAYKTFEKVIDIDSEKHPLSGFDKAKLRAAYHNWAKINLRSCSKNEVDQDIGPIGGERILHNVSSEVSSRESLTTNKPDSGIDLDLDSDKENRVPQVSINNTPNEGQAIHASLDVLQRNPEPSTPNTGIPLL